jgi:glucans biosynthesis protein
VLTSAARRMGMRAPTCAPRMALWMLVALLGGMPHLQQAQAQPLANPAPDSGAAAGFRFDLMDDLGERGATLFDTIEARAQKLASRPYDPDAAKLPEALAKLSYSQYRAIRFRPAAALWRDESLFEVQLFHPGFLYREPVVINLVEAAGKDDESPRGGRPLVFDPELFRYDGPAADVADAVTPDLGFAGFRIHFPINAEDYKDEFLVFQGASYFRIVGPGQLYGLSARGLAVDTAESRGEEFPVFREFWLEKPAADAAQLVIHALLDSPSVTGAYRFEVRPGAPTEIGVEARLYARKDVGKLGIAPLTSMFLHGKNSVRFKDDFRPQVHDSDGLLMLTAAGEWIWRPLTNPRHLHVSSLLDEGPLGFGLFQRDRDFSNYADMEARYERRPSLWVIPEGTWGRGRVELVEIPTDSETHDNITAYWVPEQALKAGERRRYRYRLRSVDASVREHQLAQVSQTRIGWAAIPGQSNPPPRGHRQFIVDFAGGPLAALGSRQPVRAEIEKNRGEISDLDVSMLPDGGGWRASFKLAPDGDQPSDMRLSLHLRDQRLSEVWSYVWHPSALE